MDKQLFNLQEAAAYLGLGVVSIKKLRAEKKLPVVKIGASTRYHRADLDRIIEEGKQ